MTRAACILKLVLMPRHRVVVASSRAFWILILLATLRVHLAVVGDLRLVHVGLRLDVDSFDADASHVLAEVVLDVARHCSHLRLLSYLREGVLVAAEGVIDKSLVFVVL